MIQRGTYPIHLLWIGQVHLVIIYTWGNLNRLELVVNIVVIIVLFLFLYMRLQ